MATIVSALFRDRDRAEQAVNWLRENGAPEDAITIVAPTPERAPGEEEPSKVERSMLPPDDVETVGDVMARDPHEPDSWEGATKGAAAGAAVGALFGLAAILIPGLGPFVTAGALSALFGGVGGTIASGALVGATAGSLAGVFAGWGLLEEEAEFYAGGVEQGGIYVGLNLDQATQLNHRDVATAFARFGGDVFGGDTDHPVDVDQVATGTLAVAPAAVADAPRLQDTVANRPTSSAGNVAATESTAGYIDPAGHYQPAVVAGPDAETDDLQRHMQAPIAEDRPEPRASLAEAREVTEDDDHELATDDQGLHEQGRPAR